MNWYEYAKAGKLFTGNIAAAGVVLPIYSATAQKVGLWNPANSNKNLIIVALRLTYVDTIGAAGGFCWGLLRNTGNNVATAAPISVFTDEVPERGLMGGVTGGNTIRWTGSASTVTTALMVVGRQIGINQLVLTPTDATNGFFEAKADYNGDLAVAPGNAIYLCGNIATLTKVTGSVTWVEEDR